jgi:rhodanese-related sulfurtransferase
VAAIQTTIIGAAPADYAGDVAAEEAWRVLQQDENALLIDVRTRPEWTFVGLPNLSSAEKKVICVEWQTFPSMELNAGFLEQVKAEAAARGTTDDANLFVICRSGARSKSASIALASVGYKAAFNVAGGFEGDLDGDRHRGSTSGWKAAGLPWSQS